MFLNMGCSVRIVPGFRDSRTVQHHRPLLPAAISSTAAVVDPQRGAGESEIGRERASTAAWRWMGGGLEPRWSCCFTSMVSKTSICVREGERF